MKHMIPCRCSLTLNKVMEYFLKKALMPPLLLVSNTISVYFLGQVENRFALIACILYELDDAQAINDAATLVLLVDELIQAVLRDELARARRAHGFDRGVSLCGLRRRTIVRRGGDGVFRRLDARRSAARSAEAAK